MIFTRPENVLHSPPLSEGEGLACRVLQVLFFINIQHIHLCSCVPLFLRTCEHVHLSTSAPAYFCVPEHLGISAAAMGRWY